MDSVFSFGSKMAFDPRNREYSPGTNMSRQASSAETKLHTQLHALGTNLEPNHLHRCRYLFRGQFPHLTDQIHHFRGRHYKRITITTNNDSKQNV